MFCKNAENWKAWNEGSFISIMCWPNCTNQEATAFHFVLGHKKCTRELPHLVIAMHIIWTLVCELPSEQCTKRHIPESPSLQLLTTSIQSMWLIDSSSKRIAVAVSSSSSDDLVWFLQYTSNISYKLLIISHMALSVDGWY